MKAVNLMPEGGRSGVSSPSALLNPASGVIALLVVVLGLVTVYVLSSNSVSSRKAQLSSLQQQVATVQAQASQLTNYVNYQKVAQQRVSTIMQLANGRFDWHGALSNLSRVMPSNAAFQSLLATASPGSSVSGAGGSVGGGAGTSGLRSDIQAPAFEVKGCSASHDDVARLLSRLRAMPGVQRVTLADSFQNGASAKGGPPASSDQPSACGKNPANFDLVIFFAALPGASTTGTPAGTAPAAGTTTAAAVTTASTAAPASTSTAAATTTTTATTATASAQPVSSASAG